MPFLRGKNEQPDIHRLINTYSKTLMRLSYIYLKDHQLAEDAVQETLIKAYLKYHTFNGISSEKTWITRIAINVCKNYLRKACNKEFASNDSITLSYASGNEEALKYMDEESICLLNAVYTLPEIYKQVILLYYYQGLKIIEISKTLKEKESTVSVRLKRGRDMLRNILKED